MGKFFIDRPVFAWVLAIFIMLAGALAITSLPVAQYPNIAPPTVVITARARMTVLPERTVASERVFTVSQPASANRVGAIVEAFDIASRDLNTQIVDWTASASQ